MKKKLLLLFSVAAVCALSLGLLAGCSGNNSGDTNEKSDNAAGSGDQYTLVVGFDQSYPPYGYVGDDGQFTGFDLDLAAEVAKRNNWEVKYEPIDWDAKDALLNAGNISCIWNGFTYEGREDQYAWSKPYMLNEQVVVVKKGSDIKNLKGLKDKTVMTQVESAALDVLKGDQKKLADTFKELQTIADYNNAFMQLESGQVDAVACDSSIAAYQMAAKADKFEKLDSLSSEHYAVGFKKGDQETADKVTETLKEMDKDGFVKDLCEKYADQGMAYENWCL